MKKFWQDFRKPIIYIILIFLGLFVYVKLAGPIPFSVNSIQTNKNDLFSVEGTGKAVSAPDMATVSVGITEKGTTVDKVQSQINIASRNIVDAIKKLGIEEKYIETTSYNVYPSYDRNQRITAYSATQNIQIKIKEIEKINDVIDTSTENGANIVGNVNFTFSDELKEKLEEKAREEAVKEAKNKAKSLARISGIKLGRLINVYENNTGYLPLRSSAPLAVGGLKEDSEAQTNITPGEETISITITLSYETY